MSKLFQINRVSKEGKVLGVKVDTEANLKKILEFPMTAKDFDKDSYKPFEEEKPKSRKTRTKKVEDETEKESE